MDTVLDKDLSQFSRSCKDKHLATLKFRLIGSDTVDFYSTYVPEACRGTGAGVHIVNDALAWAHQQHLKVIPSCWFVEKVIQKEKAKQESNAQ